ncbi:MAG: PIG-L deacetylase family protein [Promethearchaeota archaeon]
MAFAAHPDDEGAMLGTLAKYFYLNSEVIIVWATLGERWLTPLGKYSPFLHWLLFSKKDSNIKEQLYRIIGKIRNKEVHEVLSLTKFKGEFLGFIDGAVPSPSNVMALKKIIELIRTYKPRIVITHHYRELHPDHQNLSNLVYQAFYFSGNKSIKTIHKPFNPEILAWWDERGLGFKPNCYLNVNDSIKIFKDWKKIYKSQTTRIVGQIPIIKARLRAIGTPYRLVECFQIVNFKLNHKYYGELFPKLNRK